MARKPMIVQFDLFSSPSGSGIAQLPRWQTLPPPTRQVLMPLIVRLLLEHIDSDPVAEPRETYDEL